MTRSVWALTQCHRPHSVSGGVKLASGQVAAPEIGLWLSSSGSENPGSGGSLTFGGVNPSLYSGDIDFLPLTGAEGTDAWTLKVSGVQLLHMYSTASPDTSIPGSPNPTGSSTIPSGGPTQSSAVPPHPEPKPATGAIVGGVIGGFVVFMLIVAFLFYRSRRRSQQRTAISPYAPSKTSQPPLSFAIDEQDKVIQTNMIPDPSLPSTTPVVRSLFTMRREQSAALSRYGDIHTAPSGMGKTSQGLQGAHPTSSELLPTDRGSEISPEAPVAGIGNPAVLEEMQNLLAKMRRLAIEEGRAPPSYS
ncbi:hypothetical protein B0H14DRAFT_2597834 [Mycena olivaceomarginata]|nr:hypothetical protein B0H14DRAFT_2597834 [Mycena olivaceomarginata]